MNIQLTRHFYILVLTIITLCSCTINSSNDYLKKANAAIDNKKYREAIRLLDKALKKQKYLSEAYAQKAYCYSNLKKDDSAIITYKKLLSFLPNNTLALFNIGICKYRQEKFDEAIDYFEYAMISKGYHPKDTSKIQFTFEYTPEGREILGIQQRFDVPLAEIFYMAGLSHYNKDELYDAYKYFKSCISRKYQVGESYYMIGFCWLESNMNEKACESFKESLINGYAFASEQISKACK